MRSLIFISAILLTTIAHSQEITVPSYNYGQSIVAPPQVTSPQALPASQARLLYAPPQVLLAPRTYYQPFKYQGSDITEQSYVTPLRDLLFGRWHINHHYAPTTQ